MLNELEPETILRKVPQLEDKAYSFSRSIHDWVLKGGKPRRTAADLLHGTWLGHPLHPVLTDVTIGAWLFGFVLDILSLGSRSRGMKRAADTLLDIGNLSAGATALAGLSDYSTVPRKAVATGAVHAVLNTLGLALNLVSSAKRKKGSRGFGILLTSFASSIMLLSAWLGGEMVYKYQIGTNKAPKAAKEKKWHPAIPAQELPEMTPKRVEVDGSPVLLYRYEGMVHAIGAVCGHEGAPLEEGSFEGHCVTCPWHQSVYDLRDGSVVHGPTTYAEPSYEVEEMDGTLMLRKREEKYSGE